MSDVICKKQRVLAPGTPVRHITRDDVTGVVKTHFFENFATWYVIDWLEAGFAPNVRRDHIKELPTALHLLGCLG